MSAITYALQQLKFRIPEEILKLTFNTKNNWRSSYTAPLSVDDRILTKVIRPRIMVDANLVGGETVDLVLNDIPWERGDNNSVVYKIPPEKLGNRPIMSAHSVSLLPIGMFSSFETGFGQAVPFPSSALTTVASIGNRIADSYSNQPITSNTSVEVVGDFTLLLRGQVNVGSIYRVTLIVANEKNLSNINMRSWPDFAKLVELGVKSYIFNTMRIRIDEGFIEGGVDIGYVKEYIEGLSDYEEMYQTFLRENWRPVAFCNDELQYEKFIKVQISPNL